jgi:uncharacterized protein YidB (DUF937 family)
LGIKRKGKGNIMNFRTRLLSAAAAVTLLTTGAIATISQASAQEPEPPVAEQGARKGKFLERIAEKLGITQEELQAAIQAAATDAVDEALADGRITQEQADKARERIESGKGLRGFFERRQERREHRRDMVRQSLIESASTALGMTADELKTALKAGNSVADVAEAEGVSLDSVKAQITSDAEAKLDQAVADGKIKQERADAALAKLAERLDDLLSRSRQAPPAE